MPIMRFLSLLGLFSLSAIANGATTYQIRVPTINLVSIDERIQPIALTLEAVANVNEHSITISKVDGVSPEGLPLKFEASAADRFYGLAREAVAHRIAKGILRAQLKRRSARGMIELITDPIDLTKIPLQFDDEEKPEYLVALNFFQNREGAIAKIEGVVRQKKIRDVRRAPLNSLVLTVKTFNPWNNADWLVDAEELRQAKPKGAEKKAWITVMKSETDRLLAEPGQIILTSPWFKATREIGCTTCGCVLVAAACGGLCSGAVSGVVKLFTLMFQ